MGEQRDQEAYAIDVDAVAVATAIRPDAIVDNAWAEYATELYGFLRRATRDETVAEDLLQDTFLRLTAEVGRGRSPENARAWLYRVATNLVISRGRRTITARRWLVRHGSGESQPGTHESPEAGMLRRERRYELETVLNGLSADARTALLLSRDGFTGEEIAATIGRSHAATRTLLSRARVHLRLELERREAAE